MVKAVIAKMCGIDRMENEALFQVLVKEAIKLLVGARSAH
jgi:hypothetical protein